jgi:hypothetical protein
VFIHIFIPHSLLHKIIKQEIFFCIKYMQVKSLSEMTFCWFSCVFCVRIYGSYSNHNSCYVSQLLISFTIKHENINGFFCIVYEDRGLSRTFDGISRIVSHTPIYANNVLQQVWNCYLETFKIFPISSLHLGFIFHNY